MGETFLVARESCWDIFGSFIVRVLLRCVNVVPLWLLPRE